MTKEERPIYVDGERLTEQELRVYESAFGHHSTVAPRLPIERSLGFDATREDEDRAVEQAMGVRAFATHAVRCWRIAHHRGM